MEDNSGKRKYLVVCPEQSESAVLISPMLRALSGKGVYIAVLASSASAELLHKNPHVDEVIPYRKLEYENDEYLRLSSGLQQHSFDCAFFPFSDILTASLCKSALVHRRIGFAHEQSASLMTEKVEPPKSADRRVRAVALLLALDIHDVPVNTEFFPLPDSEQLRAKYKGEMFVCVSAGKADRKRGWGIGNYSKFIKKLYEIAGVKSVLLGEKEDFINNSLIYADAGKEAVLADLTQSDITESAAALENCSAFVGSVSLFYHLAAAMDKAVFGLYNTDADEGLAEEYDNARNYPIKTVESMNDPAKFKLPAFITGKKEEEKKLKVKKLSHKRLLNDVTDFLRSDDA